MTPEATARDTADAIGDLGSRFMLDMRTYQIGAELGFAGVDFYLVGRTGVLGDVPGEVAAAALVFFEPDTVVAAWDRSRPIMAPSEAAARFAEVGHDWARTHLTDEATCARLAELAGTVVTRASGAGAPIFAGWRQLPAPPDAPAAALHHMNALRELRMALHGCAIVAAGIDPHAAVALRSPGMLGLFGWSEPHPEPDSVRAAWQDAEDATDRAMGRALSTLDETERAELVELCGVITAT